MTCLIFTLFVWWKGLGHAERQRHFPQSHHCSAPNCSFLISAYPSQIRFWLPEQINQARYEDNALERRTSDTVFRGTPYSRWISSSNPQTVHWRNLDGCGCLYSLFDLPLLSNYGCWAHNHDFDDSSGFWRLLTDFTLDYPTNSQTISMRRSISASFAAPRRTLSGLVFTFCIFTGSTRSLSYLALSYHGKCM